MTDPSTSRRRDAIAAELEKVAAIKGQRARYLARKMLALDLIDQASFLARVQETYGRRVAQHLNDAFWRVDVAHFQQESP